MGVKRTRRLRKQKGGLFGFGKPKIAESLSLEETLCTHFSKHKFKDALDMINATRGLNLNHECLEGTFLEIAINEHKDDIVKDLLNLRANVNLVSKKSNEIPFETALSWLDPTDVGYYAETAATPKDKENLLMAHLKILQYIVNRKDLIIYQDGFEKIIMILSAITPDDTTRGVINGIKESLTVERVLRSYLLTSKFEDALDMIKNIDGLDLNYLDPNKETFLELAIDRYAVDIVIALLDKGADVNHASSTGIISAPLNRVLLYLSTGVYKNFSTEEEKRKALNALLDIMEIIIKNKKLDIAIIRYRECLDVLKSISADAPKIAPLMTLLETKLHPMAGGSRKRKNKGKKVTRYHRRCRT
jgi:hypothetical protein